GLGELVVPGAELTGLRWAHGGKAGPSRTFLPEITVEETAPLDSQVDLYVNDRFVQSLRVRDPLKDLPGFGFVRFEGVPLIPGRENIIRLLVTEPSGFRRELVRTVWGSDKVLAAGDSAWLVGTGTHRDKSVAENQGAFAGGLLRHGLTEWLTAELSAAYQSGFSLETSQNAPAETLHLGAGLAWQPYRGGFVRADLANSWDPGRDSTSWAARVRGDLQAGPVRLRPDVFRYGADFFDGQNASLQARDGAWMNAHWPVANGMDLFGSAGWLKGTLRGDEPKTVRETIEHLEARFSGFLPRTRLSLGADYFQQHWEGGDRPALYSAILESMPFSTVQVEARVYEGDPLASSEHLDLVGPLRLANLPFYDSPYNGGRLLWWVAPGVSASMAHWNFRTRKESLLGLGLSGSKGVRWDFQSELGKDWDGDSESLADTLVWRGRLGLYLNRAGNRRFSLQSDYRSREWSVSAFFNLLEVFGFDGPKPLWLTAQGVNPIFGTVMGKVFLDRNGDGQRQPGEPGLPGVRVIMGGQQVESDEDGIFVFTRVTNPKGERVSIDMRELDALYTPTNGTQVARVATGAVSRVELGVAILGSILGTVHRLEADGSTRPVPGVSVGLYDSDGVRVNASVTASDGSFLLGEVKPGLYWLQVEGKSLPNPLSPKTPPQKVKVVSGSHAPVDQKVDFLVAPAGEEPLGQKVPEPPASGGVSAIPGSGR
ncbi:MAG: MSCRAMM family protein, partial [Deferrisomatales bacterium]